MIRTSKSYLFLCCRVNKPYLPIAAGDLSVQSAWLLVIFFAIAGLLVVGFNFGPFITCLYTLGLFLGTIYSVPPLRMKRFPVAAFLIIATVGGGCLILLYLNDSTTSGLWTLKFHLVTCLVYRCFLVRYEVSFLILECTMLQELPLDFHSSGG